jgi:hypothetical protein
MRDAEDQPLADCVQEDAHQQEVPDALEAAPHELAPKAAMEKHPLEIWRPPRPRVHHASADAEENRDRGLQDEAKTPRARKPFGEVF